MWYPFGEQQIDVMELVCPTHCNGGVGQDGNFPLCILRVLVNHVLNVVDNGDSEGRKGPVEIYVCGVLIKRGVWKAMMKRHMSWILLRIVGSPFYSKSGSSFNANYW